MKTYIIPATTVVALQSNQMLAASEKLYEFNSNDGKGKLVNSDATGEAMTRQHSGVGSGLWSDMK